MTNSRILRLSLLASLLGSALSAHAFSILLASSGTTNFVGILAIAHETVDTQVGGYGPLSNLVLTDDGASGAGSYVGSGGELDSDYTFTNDTILGVSESLTAEWHAAGGTGTYSGATGEGSFALATLLVGGPNYPSGTVFAGDVEAVPEPAPLAALALGALALLRHQRQA